MRNAARVAVPFAIATCANACSTPSSTVAGGDLLGVFQHDGGADASTASSARPAASGHAKRDAGAVQGSDGGVVVRPPTPGKCVAEAGEAAADLRRTVGRPACRESQVLEWRDAEGSPRYACVVAPRGA